jgi:hypothetical protein
MAYNLLSIASIILWVAVPIALFAGRHWIAARVSKGIQHHFDREIETLRTELHKAEEEHRSELRSREAEIAALRSTVLAGSAGRQALVDKRRLEAVERVWKAVNDLAASLKSLSQTMAILNYAAVAKEVNDPKMQQFLSVIGSTAPTDFQNLKNVARDEQPFVSESAWAYFHAYRSILYMNLARFQVLKNAAVMDRDDPEKYFSKESLQKILIAALPHQKEFITGNDMGAYHYLLDELEASLLAELRRILDGAESDQMLAERARAIMEAVKEAGREATLKRAEALVAKQPKHGSHSAGVAQ